MSWYMFLSRKRSSILKLSHVPFFFPCFPLFLVIGRGNNFLLDFIAIYINFYLISCFIRWLNFCVIGWCISLSSVACIGHHMLVTVNYQYLITPQGTDSGVDTYFGLCTYPGRELRHRIDLKVACWFCYCNGVPFTGLNLIYMYLPSLALLMILYRLGNLIKNIDVIYHRYTQETSMHLDL